MTNHFTQEEAKKLATKMGFPIGSSEGEEFFEIASEGILALCNAAVDAKLAKAGAHGDGNRCEHGVWAADHCYRCEATHPQASEPAPAQPAQDVNAELVEALSASCHTEHLLLRGEVCRCSQCEFVRLRDTALANAKAAQQKREPLTTDTHYQEWKHGCDSMCTNITLWLDRCPHCGKPRPAIEAAHKIGGQG